MRTSVRRLAGVAVGLLLAAGLGIGAARAEVVALVGEDGQFVRTEINTVRRGRLTSVWLSDDGLRDREGRFSRIVLNESGAERGDGVPSIAINPVTRLPWAVWSFNDSGDSEIAFSLFDGTRWSPPTLLGAEANGIEDLEPKLVFAADGRPIITWWRLSADGVERSVWMTARVSGAWLVPQRLSSSRERASRPSLVLRDGELIVAFDSSTGIRILTLPADAPALGGTSTAGGVDGPDPPTNSDTRPPECQLIGCSGD